MQGNDSQTVAESAPTRNFAADLVIEDLALSEAHLVERVVELDSDNRWLRETLHEAVDMLHRTNVQLDRSKAIVIRLHDEYRRQREQIARDAEVA